MSKRANIRDYYIRKYIEYKNSGQLDRACFTDDPIYSRNEMGKLGKNMGS